MWRRAAVDQLARRRVRHVPTEQLDRPRDRRAQPRERFDQLGLAIALHPGDAQDLATAHLERQRFDREQLAVGQDLNVAQRRRHIARSGRALLDAQQRPAGQPSAPPATRPWPRSGRTAPTIAPRRSTTMRSATSNTSCSLWVMKTRLVWCSLRSVRMTRNRSSASCGVSTAVGSSRISTRASRYSAFRISARCWTPTGRSRTRASGSTGRP